MRSIASTAALAALAACITTSLSANIPRFLYAGVANELDKPEIAPPFSEAIQDKDLRIEMGYHKWKYEEWHTYWIPEACLEEAEKNHLSGSDFRVRTVWYDDCEAPWIVCRHTTAKESWDSVLTTLGQVPVGMRQYLSNLVILPGDSTDVVNAAAYTRGAVLVFTPSFFKLGVLFHEFTHILDNIALVDMVTAQGAAAGSPFSRTRMWQTAYENDTHVPTGYARVTWQEDFADIGRWAMSDLVHGGGLAGYSDGWTGCRWQLFCWKALLRDVIFTRTGRCTGKVRSSNPVKVPVAGGAVGKVVNTVGPEVVKVELEESRVREIVVPEQAEEIVHVYHGAVPARLGY